MDILNHQLPLMLITGMRKEARVAVHLPNQFPKLASKTLFYATQDFHALHKRGTRPLLRPPPHFGQRLCATPLHHLHPVHASGAHSCH